MASEKRLIDANELEERFRITKIIEVFPEWENLSFQTKYKLVQFGKTVKMFVQDAPTVDAVEVNRLGKLGRLMMPYKGDPRGNMGARGCSGEDFRAIELDPITDVDGNRWIPVLEEDLCAMKARADDTVKVVYGRWEETLVPDGYVQKASRLRKKCSVCGWTNACRYRYCPNCGADMRGDTE